MTDTAPTVVLAFERFGSQADDTVVLLHSLALDRSVWTPIAQQLAHRRHVIVPDLRGHGQSPPSSGAPIELMADDVTALLDSEGVGEVTVIGMSMGGCVAQALAIRNPGRVVGLGLVDTTAWYGDDAPTAWAQRASQAATQGLRSLADFQLSRWFSDAFVASHGPLCEALLDVFAANDIGSYQSACAALGAFDARADLGAVSVPTVIVVGEHDGATPPSHASDLHQRISTSTLHVIPECKHLSAVERAGEVLDLLTPLVA